MVRPHNRCSRIAKRFRLSAPNDRASSIPAGVAHDDNDTPNQASTSTDSVVTLLPPNLFAAAQAFAHSREHYTQFVVAAYRQYVRV